jgi:uncharacterized protein (TIGR03435 family)
MARFSRQLSRYFGRTVLDRTGLDGYYNFWLEFADDRAHPAMLRPSEDTNEKADIARPPGSSGPSIFTALREQLGLRLESTKGPVEVIVIDHIERPTEN